MFVEKYIKIYQFCRTKKKNHKERLFIKSQWQGEQLSDVLAGRGQSLCLEALSILKGVIFIFSTAFLVHSSFPDPTPIPVGPKAYFSQEGQNSKQDRTARRYFRNDSLCTSYVVCVPLYNFKVMLQKGKFENSTEMINHTTI